MQSVRRACGGFAVVGGLALIGLLVLPAVVAAADVDPGQALYQKYCASCHGMTGKGDGTVAPLMKVKPTDLTKISKESGGEFPTQKITLVIDGTKSIPAHGDSNMPVWGEVLQKEARLQEAGTREATRARGTEGRTRTRSGLRGGRARAHR